MVEHILVVRQLPCNERNNEVAIKNKTEIQLCGESNKQPPDKVNIDMVVDKNHYEHINNKYLSFSTAQQIIHRLLTCNRVVLLPTVIPGVTKRELAKKLNLTPRQLRYLQERPLFYERMVKYTNLPLVSLYCSSALQEPRSLHTPHKNHGGEL
jgi:hypothetical protein